MEKKGIIYTKASSVKFKTDAEVIRERLEALEYRLRKLEVGYHVTLQKIKLVKCLNKEG